MILNKDRLTCAWKITGTESFRLASSKLLDFYGVNLQNPSETLMRCVVPEDNKVFIQPDQSGAEALVVAMETRPGKFRKLFDLNIKVHSYMALQLFTDKFRGKHPSLRYKNVDPATLATYPELKELLSTIKNSSKEYDLGKRVIHCLTPDHEVLTKNGWISVDKVSEFIPIAVWSSEYHTITFEVPSVWNRGYYTGDVHCYEYPKFSQRVTPQHNFPLWTNNRIKATSSIEVSHYHGGGLPVNGYYSGDRMVPLWEARLVAATQADGSILNPTTIKFRFAKLRKIDRLIMILKKLEGLEWDAYVGVDNVWNCTVRNAGHIIEHFAGNKVFDSWLLTWHGSSLDALIRELQHWDGYATQTRRHKREVFYSSQKENIEWLQTILHLRGKQGSPHFSLKGHHQLGINERQYACTAGCTVENYSGMVYCPTVSTGYFLVRRNGKISVTGNSKNYSMGPRTFQLNVLELSEGAVILSFKEAKEFLATHEMVFPEILEWQAAIKGQVAATRILRNLFGYPRVFTRLWNDALEREALAFVAQSTVGTITNLAYTEMFNRIRKERLPWTLLNNKHDSLLLEVPDTTEHREQGMAYCKEHMGRRLTSSRGEEYRMKVGLSVGYNWGHYHEEHNKDGLKELN